MATKKVNIMTIKNADELMKAYDAWKTMPYEKRLELTDVVAKNGGKYAATKTPKGYEIRYYSSGLVCIEVGKKASVALKSGHTPTLTINYDYAPDENGCYTTKDGKKWKPSACYRKGNKWYQAVCNLWVKNGNEYDLSNNSGLKRNLEAAF